MKRLVYAFVLLGVAAEAQPSTSIDSAGLAKRALPAVVCLRGTTAGGEQVIGSGFIVDPSGTIITSLQIISKMTSGSVRLAKGDVYDRFVIKAFDERRDLAVIQIPGFKLPTIALGDSDEIKPGAPVIVLGNSDHQTSVTTGVVSAIRKLEAGFEAIQTDTAVHPGNDGGPMLDAKGAVVGVIPFKRPGAETLEFAIPINYARGLLSSSQALTLQQLQGQLLGSAESDISPASESHFPIHWKDVQSGSMYKLRRNGELIYIELVLPAAWHQPRDFGMAELKKNGDRYVGTLRWTRGCTFPSRLDSSAVAKFCSFSFQLELTSITPTRIEGFTVGPPPSANFNCRHCKHSLGTTRQKLILIPETP